MDNVVKAIDIRYNLEYVGFKRGLDRRSNGSKHEDLRKSDETNIKKHISHNGCPSDFTECNFERFCDTGKGRCVKCWEQEAGGNVL
jgi:hypothetical protein